MTAPILVLAEQLRGQLSDITFEMLGAARKLAAATQAPLCAVLLGREAAPLAPALGAADKVLVVDDPALDLAAADTIAAALAALAAQQSAGLVLIGGTNVSLGVGAALAVRTGLPFVNFVRAMHADGDALTVTSQLLGGKMLADVALADRRGIVGLAPGAFPAEAGRVDRAPVVEHVSVAIEPPKVAFKRFLEAEAADVDITKQEVLVAVGRGIQSQDNMPLAEELAGLLGGAVCASRPVIDQGWVPLSRQVGKSGMTVKPRVYLAYGISGAPEHWEGMQGSQCIIAINTDPKAPIFDGAHYGVCGDALEHLPALVERIKARKG